MHTITIDAIQALTKDYSAARARLNDRVSAYHSEVLALNRRKLPGIRWALAEASDAKAKLEAAISAAPHLFEKPRTLTLHGIKVGLQKGKGTITWTDADKVVELIKRQFGDEATPYLSIIEKPAKKALATLDVATLRKLGCTVEETGDRVYVAAEDTAVDKLVERILKEGQGEEIGAAGPDE